MYALLIACVSNKSFEEKNFNFTICWFSYYVGKSRSFVALIFYIRPGKVDFLFIVTTCIYLKNSAINYIKTYVSWIQLGLFF